MDRVLPLRRVILFGSHARDAAGPDSDLDLCLIADGAGHQLEAAARGAASMEGAETPEFAGLVLTFRRFSRNHMGTPGNPSARDFGV